jgi:DNA-binding SARP family transcriptional activator
MVSLSADRLLLLGPLRVFRNGSLRPQPPSRKVRALLAYLAMATRPITREKLCELFWDVADDPRGELRWCLSKLRPLVDGPKTIRLIADRKEVHIEANSFDVDALLVARRAQTRLTADRQAIFGHSWPYFAVIFSKVFLSKGLPHSKTGSRANGTALRSCGSSYSNA